MGKRMYVHKQMIDAVHIAADRRGMYCKYTNYETQK